MFNLETNCYNVQSTDVGLWPTDVHSQRFSPCVGLCSVNCGKGPNMGGLNTVYRWFLSSQTCLIILWIIYPVSLLYILCSFQLYKFISYYEDGNCIKTWSDYLMEINLSAFLQLMWSVPWSHVIWNLQTFQTNGHQTGEVYLQLQPYCHLLWSVHAACTYHKTVKWVLSTISLYILSSGQLSNSSILQLFKYLWKILFSA